MTEPAGREDGEWIVTRHRVIYADTDAMGVVYYGNYMRFLEVGRCEYLRARAIPYREVEESGFLMPVAEAGLKYFEPAGYDDLLEIAARLEKLKRASLRFGYRITRPADGKLLATGFTRHACLDADTRRLARLPEDLVRRLEADGTD